MAGDGVSACDGRWGCEVEMGVSAVDVKITIITN